MMTIVLAAAEEEHSILLPQTADLLWGTVCFVVVFALLLIYALPRFNKVLDERREQIEGGLRLAEEVKDQAASSKVQVEAELKAARVEAARIKDQAQAEAKEIVAAAAAAAQEEVDRIKLNSLRQIEAERQAAQISLRTDVGMLASELAARIVGEQLKDTELSARVIDRFMDELEAVTTASS